MTKYAPYEPGEPAEVKAKTDKAAARSRRWNNVKDALDEFWYYAKWWLLAIIILALIVFGFNRAVHFSNEEDRKAASWYSNCVVDGNHVYYYMEHNTCFSGNVTTVDVSETPGQTQCLVNGDYVVKIVGVDQHLCLHGRVISVY